MNVKEQRKLAAREHFRQVDMLFATETQKTIDSALLYSDAPELSDNIARYDSTAIEVAAIDAASAVVKACGKACVLDFASYLHPGGGYDRGAWAQEEALCAASNLFNILDCLRKIYYDPNRDSAYAGLYTNRALYLTDVVFVPDDGACKRDVIVCAAPNRRRALEVHSPSTCNAAMASRVRTVMGIAAVNKVDELVLGAFGCGVFGNDPTYVALLFRDWLCEHPGVFQKVVFAIPGGKNLAAFKEVFAKYKTV